MSKKIVELPLNTTTSDTLGDVLKNFSDLNMFPTDANKMSLNEFKIFLDLISNGIIDVEFQEIVW